MSQIDTGVSYVCVLLRLGVDRSRGRVNDTIRLYYEAAKVKPNDARILMNAAVVLADEQRLSEAVVTFVRAAALAPHDTLLLSNYGTVLHRMGKCKQLCELLMCNIHVRGTRRVQTVVRAVNV